MMTEKNTTRVAALRERCGLTVDALAKLAGVSAADLSAIETGKGAVDTPMAGRIAKALLVPLDVAFPPSRPALAALPGALHEEEDEADYDLESWLVDVIESDRSNGQVLLEEPAGSPLASSAEDRKDYIRIDGYANALLAWIEENPGSINDAPEANIDVEAELRVAQRAARIWIARQTAAGATIKRQRLATLEAWLLDLMRGQIESWEEIGEEAFKTALNHVKEKGGADLEQITEYCHGECLIERAKQVIRKMELNPLLFAEVVGAEVKH